MEQVLILNHSGGIVFSGQARCIDRKQDPETGCEVAQAHIGKGVIVPVWEIDGQWQGWL